MESVEELKNHYNWTTADELNLQELAALAEARADRFVTELYTYLENFPDTEHYLPNPTIRKRHQEKLRNWFIQLFGGDYGTPYLRRLYHIGEVHVRIGLPPHYVIATMNFVRSFITEQINGAYQGGTERATLLASANKILDLNLDVMISSYREEELKLYLSSSRFQKSLIELARRISYAVDTAIIVFLIVAALFMIGVVAYDIFLMVVQHQAVEASVANILGYALFLYAISELLAEEIKHIRGGILSLKAFVDLALAAIIRKVLIVSLIPNSTNELLVLSLLLIALGGVYFIIQRAGR